MASAEPMTAAYHRTMNRPDTEQRDRAVREETEELSAKVERFLANGFDAEIPVDGFSSESLRAVTKAFRKRGFRVRIQRKAASYKAGKLPYLLVDSKHEGCTLV